MLRPRPPNGCAAQPPLIYSSYASKVSLDCILSLLATLLQCEEQGHFSNDLRYSISKINYGYDYDC